MHVPSFSMAMLVPNAAPRQLVTKPILLFFFGFWVGGMLTSLWTCSRHVCFVNFGVWVGWGDVNVPVNLLTSCMLRELRVCLGYIYIYIYTYIYKYIHTYIHTHTQYSTMKITFRYIYIYMLAFPLRSTFEAVCNEFEHVYLQILVFF